MTTLRQLHFYSTPEHECSYISGRMARTLFVDPQAIITTDAYSQLSDLGFRRSGKHIYRPHCEDCQACVSVRIPVNEFKPSKSQRRILNRNRDLRVERVNPVLTDEHYDLYSRYIHSRHFDGDRPSWLANTREKYWGLEKPQLKATSWTLREVSESIRRACSIR